MADTNTVYNYPGVHEVAGMVISPSGGRVSFVGTSAILDALGQTGEAIASRSYTSVNAAINECVTGRGDWVFMLPGYAETIDSADEWSNLGTKTDITVAGLGHNTNRPSLTWSTATSTVLFDAANFRILNSRLFMAGATGSSTAVTVAAPITVSAAGCEISDCYINFGVDADQIVTIGITTTADGDDFVMLNDRCVSATAAECTTFIQLVGCDRNVMKNVTIQGATSSTTVGTVRFLTTASTQIYWENCTIQNMKAASVHAVTCMNGATGQVVNCNFGILDNATLAGFVPGSAGNGPQMFRCQTTNLAAENSAATTPVSV